MIGSVPRTDLLVLAGGRGSRIGGNKPAVLIAKRTLLDRVLDSSCVAQRTVVVAPTEARAAAGARADSVHWTLEDPPFGGPVAGLNAGLLALEGLPIEPEIRSPEWVLLLACDLPWAATAAPRLLAALQACRQEQDGVYFVDEGGRNQWLLGVYRKSALRAALEGLDSVRDASMRRVLAGLRLATLADTDRSSTDVDTWQDVEEIGTRPRSPKGAQ